ncbi:MAG: carbon storage regulator [Planctomycetaceae bacterium]
MLVLTRKMLETIFIGGGNATSKTIKVTVLDIIGGKVRLGFEAAADIPILRGELWNQMHGNDRSGGAPEEFNEIKI